MRSLISLLGIFSLALLASASPIRPRQQRLCNGHADFCDRKYTNVSYIGTHDSAFVGDISNPAVNQEISVTGQLDAGIRFLEAQTHKDLFGTLSMCHTNCLIFDAGSTVDYLSTIKSWLDSNPNEQITVLLANGDNVDITMFDDAFKSSGLKDYAFVPSTSPDKLGYNDWPTIGSLIDSGKRAVIFLDYGAQEEKVPYILNEYKYFFETPFDVTDPSFSSCAINRPPGASPDDRMMLVNHFLDTKVLGSGILVPDSGADFQTNAATGPGSIGAQVDLCTSTYGRTPNFVLLDMFNRGTWEPAQHLMNYGS